MVAMVTIHFHIAQMSLSLGTFFSHSGVGGTGFFLAPMKNCQGVQGRSN